MVKNAVPLNFFLYISAMKDEFGKTCPHCHEYLLYEEYYWREDRQVYSSWCIGCQKIKSHERYEKGLGARTEQYWLIPDNPGVFRHPEDKENTSKFLTSIGWKYNDIYHCWTKKGLVEIINGQRTWLNIKEDLKKPKRHFIKLQEKKEILKRSMKQRTVERPTYEILQQQIQELGYRATGRFYGKSDNGVRKWLRFYEKLYEI